MERQGDESAVGIMRICAYVPRTAVSQHELERHYGVSPGKYTIGLGQNHMTFVTDREDVVSLALTATAAVVRGSGVSYEDIGRMEVGTETIMDRSKSLKSRLMTLFEASGNTEVEGLDNTNACYGGTAALLNSTAWLDSAASRGRLALVVCADISVYARGPGRATGGAGAVAMLLGRGEGVRIALERTLRATHMENTHDFFKPDFSTEYPTVDGSATLECYLRALDIVYEKWKLRASLSVRHPSVHYVLFHSPFNKMVRKALARLLWHDFEHGHHQRHERFYEAVRKWHGDARMRRGCNKEAMAAFVSLSESLYEEKCAPGAWVARETGNMYTASLYANLCALIAHQGDGLVGKRILMYSFGSGLAATMFSMRVVRAPGSMATDVKRLLGSRIVVSAEEYERWMETRQADFNRFAYEPRYPTCKLNANTYYLRAVADNGQRLYACTPGGETGRSARSQD